MQQPQAEHSMALLCKYVRKKTGSHKFGGRTPCGSENINMLGYKVILENAVRKAPETEQARRLQHALEKEKICRPFV